MSEGEGEYRPLSCSVAEGRSGHGGGRGRERVRGRGGREGFHWPYDRCVVGSGKGGRERGTGGASEGGRREGYSRIVGRIGGGQWEGSPCLAASRWLCSSAGRERSLRERGKTTGKRKRERESKRQVRERGSEGGHGLGICVSGETGAKERRYTQYRHTVRGEEKCEKLTSNVKNQKVK